MKVATSRFGELEVREEEIFTAVRPVPGFPNSTRFFFIERKNIAPFKWMQSTEEDDLTFVVVEPHNFFHDYDPRVGVFDLEEIGLEKGEAPFVLVIVVLPEDLTKMTAGWGRGSQLASSQRGSGARSSPAAFNRRMAPNSRSARFRSSSTQSLQA